VHPAQGVAAFVERHVPLRVIGVQARPPELVDAEAAGEEAALVCVAFELDEIDARQALLGELHRGQLTPIGRWRPL